MIVIKPREEVKLLPIRNNLHVLMAKKGIRSYSELARRTGYHYSRVRHFGNEVHQRIDTELISDLCKELDCELSEMLYIE